MKKAAVGMLVVLALSFGFVPRAESGLYSGCVRTVDYQFSGDKIRIRVSIKGRWIHILAGRIKADAHNVRHWITYEQAAMMEPIVRALREHSRANRRVTA